MQGDEGSLGVPHLTKTAPSGRDISARPALTYLHSYIFFTLLVYMSMTPVIFFTDVLLILLLLLVYMSMTPVIYMDVARG